MDQELKEFVDRKEELRKIAEEEKDLLKALE
jgi:hypothetical protein